MSAPGGVLDAPGLLVEAATWRPVAVDDVDGWQVGLSGGFTRRANSALPLVVPADLDATLTRVEARYAAAGLPAVVRVCAAGPAGLADALAARGYVERAVTSVLVRDLAGSPPTAPDLPGDLHVAVADEPDDAWIGTWLGVKAAAGGVDAGTARAVVAGSPALYLTVTSAGTGEGGHVPHPHDAAARAGDARDDAAPGSAADHAPGAPLAVIRAALVPGWTGLSCLVVAPVARRQGIGRLLTRAALHAAASRGADRAFLQVEVANAGAAALYGAEGFRPAERYAYWER